MTDRQAALTALLDQRIAEQSAILQRSNSPARKDYYRGRVLALKDFRDDIRALAEGEGT